MLKAWFEPWFTVIVPAGVIPPFPFAVAEMEYVTTEGGATMNETSSE